FVEAGDTGVVDEDVEAAVPFEDELHRGAPVRVARDVEPEKGSAEFLRDRPAAGFVDVGDEDAGAFGGEPPRGGLADAAGRACNQRRFSVQSSHEAPGQVSADDTSVRSGSRELSCWFHVPRSHAMKPELFWLALTATMTALFWIPYILNRAAHAGLAGALGTPKMEAPSVEAEWAQRAR